MPDSKIVNFEEVKSYITDKNACIIDVREPGELAEGQIPGSINIPLANVEHCLTKLSDDEFKNRYKRSKPAEDSILVFSCKLGGRALKATQAAEKLGYKNAKCYKGSWVEWSQKMADNA